MSAHTVLVTGASSGIGEAVAHRFLQSGARVILAARRVERLEKIAAQYPDLTLVLPLDVSDREQVEQKLSSLPEPFSAITVLVNNAGGALGLEKAPNANLDDWVSMIDVNVKGAIFVLQSVLTGMVQRHKGHVIQIGSVAGTYPYPGGNVYGGTKAFIEQLSLNLRSDLLGTRVRVTNIEPGMVETEFSKVRFKGDQARADATYANFEPLQADDIAETVFWCANLPERVNINRLEVMPVNQAFAGFSLHRNS